MPAISVIMPVYNVEKYLHASIDSILHQDFQDFECIIINDGSTDGSDKIIKTYSDPRIRYISNSGNKGLVYTLNLGIELAKGEWIARMDGDDLSLPNRFTAQLSYLKEHQEIDVLATTVKLIDEKNEHLGYWEDDVNVLNTLSIRKYLPKNNCIAHPTILCKTDLLRSFLYKASQSQSEDYDLWLRMAASGKIFAKLETPLVLHRIVSNSFTRSRQQNVFRKLAKTKWQFLKESIGKNYSRSFLLETAFYAGTDLIKSWFKSLKRSYVV